MIDLILGCTVFGVFILYSFTKGIKIGQRLSNNEPIEVISPIKELKKSLGNIKAKKEQEKFDKEVEIMMTNIDNYDGSGIGQREIDRED